MILVCQHCGYSWDYLGDSDYRACCPQCLCKTPVPRKPGTPVRYLWTGLAVILICLVLLPGVVLADEPVILMNRDCPVFDEKPLEVSVSYLTTQKSIITKFMEFVGLEPVEKQTELIVNSIDVFIGEFRAATIPEGSKFSNMVIHDTCLGYQYGTDAWYECEVPLQ
jgi:hypothetical protein